MENISNNMPPQGRGFTEDLASSNTSQELATSDTNADHEHHLETKNGIVHNAASGELESGDEAGQVRTADNKDKVRRRQH
jgi:hypothetical protein